MVDALLVGSLLVIAFRRGLAERSIKKLRASKWLVLVPVSLPSIAYANEIKKLPLTDVQFILCFTLQPLLIALLLIQIRLLSRP